MTEKQTINDDLMEKLAIEQGTAQVNLELLRFTSSIESSYRDGFKIEVEVLDGGKIPSKANVTDAGFDVFATSDVTIYPGQITKHPLNFRMKLPQGSWAQIETKSGLGSKGMLVYAGVIDEGYRGIPHVIATSLNWGIVWKTGTDGAVSMVGDHPDVKPILIKKGDKIAQITMNPHSNEYHMIEVESVDTATNRGQGGFGSSGA